MRERQRDTSNSVIARAPEAPPSKADQNSSTPLPSGLTTPIPVTTTRRPDFM
jgi:hypothetical protein